MRKRLLLAGIILLSFPVLANAWYVTGSTTPVSGSYGTISPAGQTYVASITATQDFVVSPAVGFALTKVTLDGAIVSPKAGTTNTYTVGYKSGATYRNLLAYFTAAAGYSTAVNLGSGGAYKTNPSGQTLTNIPAGSSRTILITPYSGKQIDSISAPGGVIGDVNDGAGTKSVIYSSITTNMAISATFKLIPALIANAGPDLSTQGNSAAYTAVLDGSLSTSNIGAITYNWSVTGPGTGVLSSASAQKPTFYSTTPGAYTASLTITSGGVISAPDTAVITVVSRTAFRELQCSPCHLSRNAALINLYNTSPHKAAIATPFVDCQICHDPTNTGHYTIASPVDSCSGCHADSSGSVSGHPIQIGTTTCITCHDPHSTVGTLGSSQGSHYNNITSAMYPASYVTSRAVCANCHYVSATNATVRHEWARSGHAAVDDYPWRSDDFKTKPGCVQCHTTTGFIAYSTGKVTAAWGNAGDKTKEVLTCIGCHNNITNGALRTVTPVAPYADDSYVNPNIGKSNICMDCHSGAKNGKSIAVKLDAYADFTNQPFIDPHYLTAGGTIYGKAGYHFPGRTYSSNATHSSVGINNNNGTGSGGPCVACHKNSTYGHTFQTGAISLCANCHGGFLSAQQLNADKLSLANALETLRAQLAANGFVYSPNYPYFSNTNWGTGDAGADTMGAAFNYVLLVSEPGAYVHNPVYAKQLVLDSIDYLDNGQFDDSINNLAIPTLLGSGAISQAVADGLISYKAKTLCTTCHGGTASTASPMSTNAHPTHLTGADGPGFFLGSDVSSCQACHVYGSATHMNGSVDLVTGAGSACQGCHPGTIPAWNLATPLDCVSCHAAVPSVLPNGTAAPFKGSFATTGHGHFAGSNHCTDCHDPDSRHISGTLGTYTRLRLLNDNNLCASCHNNASLVGSSFLNMSTHVTKDGRALACLDCHDPHGTVNQSMIRLQINGSTITFTDNVNGFVDPVTNQGLCQVCHTATNHYRSGVPETQHPTTSCLGCHAHNAAGGAFKPNGACDACHGYPPAPKVVISAVTFGTMNNWSSARFEDYSGGGGAHLVAQHVAPNAKPSEGWANCTVCHNGGVTNSAPYHKMVLPVQSHISNVHIEVDPQYRFNNGFIVYTGAKLVNPPAQNATGSCFNVSCHMGSTPRWSIER